MEAEEDGLRSVKALLSCRIRRLLDDAHPWTRPYQTPTNSKPEQMAELQSESGTLVWVSSMDGEPAPTTSPWRGIWMW